MLDYNDIVVVCFCN